MQPLTMRCRNSNDDFQSVGWFFTLTISWLLSRNTVTQIPHEIRIFETILKFINTVFWWQYYLYFCVCCSTVLVSIKRWHTDILCCIYFATNRKCWSSTKDACPSQCFRTVWWWCPLASRGWTDNRSFPQTQSIILQYRSLVMNHDSFLIHRKPLTYVWKMTPDGFHSST